MERRSAFGRGVIVQRWAVVLGANPLGATRPRRDVRSITTWFAARGAGPEKSDLDGLCRLLGEVAHIR